MQGASQTAVMTAVSRGAHHFMDPDPIFSDTYALALVGMTELEAVEFLRAAGPERLWHVARLFVCPVWIPHHLRRGLRADQTA